MMCSFESASSASFKAPAISIDSICPSNQPRRNQKTLNIDQTPNKSYPISLALYIDFIKIITK